MIVLPIVIPKTCPILEAGSVLTSSTYFPRPASSSAVAQATDVLPTPPLPVKKRNLGGSSRNFMTVSAATRAAAATADRRFRQTEFEARGGRGFRCAEAGEM